MIEALERHLPRLPLFILFNVTVAGFLALFVVAPVVSHFSSQSDSIAESSAQLAQLESINRQARSLIGKTTQEDDPFLPGREERVVSADLQTSLKAMAEAAGVRLISIRAAQASRPQQLAMTTVTLTLEGPLPAVRTMIQGIESRTPFLFVTSAVLRNMESDENTLRAELTVQGAMRSQKAASDNPEASAR